MKNAYAKQLLREQAKYAKGIHDGEVCMSQFCLLAFNNAFGEVLPDEYFIQFERELQEVYDSFRKDCRETEEEMEDIVDRVVYTVKHIREMRGMDKPKEEDDAET